MLRIIPTSDPDASAWLDEAAARRRPAHVEDAVSPIVEAVRKDGDAALCSFTKRFDGVELAPADLVISERAIAEASVDPRIEDALRRAIARIEDFHRHELKEDWWTLSPDGAVLGQRIVPLDAVGVYVPGGAAPYASSLLMSAVPARIAGVPRIVAVTPPGPGGAVDPTLLVAARLCGIEAFYRIGGAQAIAALAYGTESIPQVAKIVGPGNAYVTAAKRLVFGDVGIDTIAGPSEVAVLAEPSADSRLVAADLLAQAEHGDDAFVVLLTTEMAIADAVNRELANQLGGLERAHAIQAALPGGAALIAADLSEALEWVERIAPEHLELFVADPPAIVPRVRAAGVILCGPLAPAALCDYGIGPNHILPTGGAARFSSALGVDDFVRRVSVVMPGRSAFDAVVPDGIALAEAEGLTAHAAALRARTEEDS